MAEPSPMKRTKTPTTRLSKGNVSHVLYQVKVQGGEYAVEVVRVQV